MTTTEKIRITLSDASPVTVDTALWPVVACADRHDGKVASQANTEWRIRVRQHADGRRLVYGSMTAGDGGQYAGFRERHAGYLLPASGDEADTIRAIRRVAGVIDDDDLAAECIADLPPRELA